MRVDHVVAPVVERARPDRRLLDRLVEAGKVRRFDLGGEALLVHGADALVLQTNRRAQVLPEVVRQLVGEAETVDVDVLDRLARREEERREGQVAIEKVRVSERELRPVAPGDRDLPSNPAESMRPNRLL